MDYDRGNPSKLPYIVTTPEKCTQKSVFMPLERGKSAIPQDLHPLHVAESANGYIYIYTRSTNQSTMINVKSTWTSSQKPIARGSFSVYWNSNLGDPNANPSENQVQFQSNVKTTKSLLLKAYCYLEGARLHSKFPWKKPFSLAVVLPEVQG